MKQFNFNTLSKTPSKFYRYTGLEVEKFLILADKIAPLWKKAERKRLFRPNRQRAIGGGRKYYLKSMEDKMLLVFVFYRLYLNYDFLGFLFGFDGTNTGRLIKRVEPVLAKKFKLPSIKRLSPRPISNLEQLREICPDIDEIIGDCTEQEIPRPKDKRKRAKYYSGKKKRHTLKTQIFIERKSGQILEISQPVPGSIHDYKLFKMTKTGERLPRDKPCYLDKGYQGAQKDYPDLRLFIPKKANRWHKLTKKDKEFNKVLHQIRVKVEHSILKCKRFKILSQIYRHSLRDYSQRFQVIAGIINFQLRNKGNFIPGSIPIFAKEEIVFSKV
ncbi:MAG: transposase family protein [Methanosarcinales archaeon]